ncbi:MAG: DNA-3-methyladenine glycosylase [Actinomycetota bacterium]|nr:DNA-3-methyladenine glycosylase [Actinomycetota bacterium]
MSQEILIGKTYKPLPVDFYNRSTDAVATGLLGNLIVRRTAESIMVARIVETEAYFGEDDPASHAYRGATPRSAIMFGRAGIAYVYLNYGVHNLLNVVTGPEGQAGAVLIRALEPIAGTETMLKNRPVKKITNLTSGPGKLTKALRIGLEHNGLDLTKDESEIFIAAGLPRNMSIQTSPRIGISAGSDLLLRFYIEGNPFVSR